MWKVNEIFASLQGEGFNTGTPCVFVRFSGCNLACDFCDTQHQQGEPMSLPQLIEAINAYPQLPLVVLTGGEPSLVVTDELVTAIHSLTGKRIAIETNGTHALPSGIDWVTLSPKDAASGGDKHPCILDRCDELKVVYVGQDLSRYDHIAATYRFLQPCWVPDATECARNMQATVDAVLARPTWRLSLQTHRVLGIR